MKPTRLRGFSDAYGSWKIIIISRRNGRISARESLVMSWPRNLTEPPVGSSSFMMQRAIVDLPQPDSPTTPSVSPSLIANETPSTAFTEATSFWKMIPRVTGKYFWRSSTTRSSSPVSSSCVWRSIACSGTATLRRLRHHAGEELSRLPVLGLFVQVTRLEVPRVVGNRRQRGVDLLADRHHIGAARMEAAARRRAQHRRRLALDLHE